MTIVASITLAIAIVTLIGGMCCTWLVLKAMRSMTSVISNLNVQSIPPNSVLRPTEYLLTSQQFPETVMIERSTQTESQVKLSRDRENLLLITAMGCGSCLEMLVGLSRLNLSNLVENMIIVSFLTPRVSQEVADTHLQAANALSVQQYLMDVKGAEHLKITKFPLLIRIAPDGRIIEAYTASYHIVSSFMHFKGTSLVS